jgi:hypothetical protein
MVNCLMNSMPENHDKFPMVYKFCKLPNWW